MSCFLRRHAYFTGRRTNVCLTGSRATPHSNSSNSPWKRQRPRCRTVAVTYRPVTSARLLFVRRHRRPGRPCPIRVIRLPPPTRSTCFRTNKTTRTNGTIVSTSLLRGIGLVFVVITVAQDETQSKRIRSFKPLLLCQRGIVTIRVVSDVIRDT